MPPSSRRSPAQHRRRAEILAVASGRALIPRSRRSAPLLPEAARQTLAAHGDEGGRCRAGCGAWPCDAAIYAATTGGGPC